MEERNKGAESLRHKAGMKKMSPGQWNVMSNEQKAAHFESNDVECRKQSMLNGNAKATDPSEKKVVTWYQAYCGGVIVSRWKKTEQEALEEASKNIAYELQLLLPTEDGNQLTIDN